MQTIVPPEVPPEYEHIHAGTPYKIHYSLHWEARAFWVVTDLQTHIHEG